MVAVSARLRVQLGIMIVVLGACAVSLCVLAPPLGQLVRRVLGPLALSLPASLAAIGAFRGARWPLARFMPPESAEPGLVTLATELTVGLPLFGALCFVVGWAGASPTLQAIPLGVCASLGALRVWGLRKRSNEAPRWPTWLVV